MTAPSPFLTATWSNLLLFTYAIDPEILRPRLAEGLELDTIDGEAFVSLVAFDFLNTRVKGISFPGFRNFPEINLRFYVREPANGRRGVMFVRELVPSLVIAWTAQALYNEPYVTASMKSQVVRDETALTVRHDWTYKGRSHAVEVVSSPELRDAEPDSLEHFFKEHEWGYGKARSGAALVYTVNHVRWPVHDVVRHTVDVDFARLYGQEFEPLNRAEPMSIMHAKGSAVEVYPPAFGSPTPVLKEAE